MVYSEIKDIKVKRINGKITTLDAIIEENLQNRNKILGNKVSLSDDERLIIGLVYLKGRTNYDDKY